MTSNKFAIVAIVAVAVLLGSITVSEAYAASYSGPTYDNQKKETTGKISRISQESTNSNEGAFTFRAFRDSGISLSGQTEIEFRKQITVSAGDTITIDSRGYTRDAVFTNTNGYGHVAVHPTITKVADNEVGTILSGCSLSFTATTINSNGLLTPMFGDMTCTGLAAGDYYVSSYVHVRTDNIQNSQVRGSVYGVTLDIEVT